LVQSVYKLFETNARKKQLDYRLGIEVTHNGIMIDALMLNQIMSNLLSNAIKFTNQGSVSLLLRELPDAQLPGRGRFAIQIGDTGIGLTEAQQREIFEPFVQAAPRQHRAIGTGLGLSICASLAKLLDAQLTVDSQQGLGSRFTLVFEADLTAVVQDDVVHERQLPSAHKLKILVVEDHAPNRLLLCQQLEYLGHQAVPCDDGETALERWMHAEPPFDLTITDCNMPHMDGYELSRKMRKVEQERAVRGHPIFGLTANAQSHVIDLCMDAGMTRCLFKPLGIEALTPLIGEVAQQSERWAQAAGSTTGGELQKLKLLKPESYGPLVDEIVRAQRQDTINMAQLVQDNNLPSLARIAHKIKGGAQLTGDHALIEACERLEQLAKEGRFCQEQVDSVVNCMLALETRLLEDR
jgi:two-component system sensor histidine kinase EvgS